MRSILLAGLLAAGAGLHAAPSISLGGVVNSTDQAPAISAGIPRGGLFSVYGTELAPREVQAPNVPLSTTLSTVRVRISAPSPLGVRDYYAPLHYVSPGQINAVLPSTLPEGAAELRVVVNTVPSEPVTIQVVGSRYCAFTRNGWGFGPAIAQQFYASGGYGLNLFQAPARAGDAVVLWGTGLGPVDPGQDAAPEAGNLRDDVMIYAGGVATKPFYAGRAPGLPGVDQINFYLPENATQGCFTPVLVEVGGESAGMFTFSAASGSEACASELNLPRSAWAALDEGKTLRVAVVDYVSDPGARDRQTLKAWVGEYDAATLSLLATAGAPRRSDGAAWCQRRAYMRRRSPTELDPWYGLRVLGNIPLRVRVTGDGCAWTTVSGTQIVDAAPNGACTATGVELTATAPGRDSVTASDELPELWKTVVRDFDTTLSNQSLRATWETAEAAEADRAAVTIGSTFALSGNIFAGLITTREMICRAPARAKQYAFTREQTAWARGLPAQSQPTLEVSRAEVRALLPSAGSLSPETLDLVLLRTRDQVSLTDQ